MEGNISINQISTFFSNFRLERKFLIPIMTVMIFGVSAAMMQDAEASHFRFGHLNWVATGTGFEVVFDGDMAWRTSSGWSCKAVGDVTVPCSDGSGNPGIGDSFSTTDVEFGDGSDDVDTCITVEAKDIPNDWIFGAIVSCDTLQSIKHTYPGPGPFTAFFESCCRINSLVNDPDSFRVESIVNFVGGNTQSPVSVIVPIVGCPVNALCQFIIPAADGDGDSLSYRQSTSAESTEMGEFDVFDQSHYTINSGSGLFSFDTAGTTSGDLYAQQVTIEETQNPLIGKVVVDFIIEIGVAGNPPPAFIPPTPASGTNFEVIVNNEITFDVKCEDPDSETVTIMGLSLPPGSSFTPSAPSGDPAMGTFSWTPTQAGDAAMIYTCRDSGLASAPPLAISITVTEKPVTKFRLLGHDNQNHEILTINTVTGQASLLGATGFDSGASGMASVTADVDTALGVQEEGTNFGIFQDDTDVNAGSVGTASSIPYDGPDDGLVEPASGGVSSQDTAIATDGTWYEFRTSGAITAG